MVIGFHSKCFTILFSIKSRLCDMGLSIHINIQFAGVIKSEFAFDLPADRPISMCWSHTSSMNGS